MSLVAQRTAAPVTRLSNTISSMDKKPAVKSEDKSTKSSPVVAKQDIKAQAQDSTAQPTQETDAKDSKAVAGNEIAKPLAPPPRPAQKEGQDYFSGGHSTTYSLEPNLFEQSFGNPSTDTPNKLELPSVASLTSPAPLTGNTGLGGGFWGSSSLRSGPLSPAMLSGPTGGGDYFDSRIGGFPTPNESSLRTGLTPGGGGSMFPAPSPNTAAIFSQLGAAGITPGTIDFHRTALNARKNELIYPNNGTHHTQQVPQSNMSITSQPTEQHFGEHDNDAANGLFMLAQAGTGSQNQFIASNQPRAVNSEQASNHATRAARNAQGSLGGSVSSSAHDHNDDASDGQTKTNTRKSKRASTGKATNNRRKADETPSKQPAAKKSKTAQYDDGDGGDSDEEPIDMKADQYHENGKKMTDEEKRKNFLERNRVAALKCRQRKKQWLANLQQKVEIFSSENDTLSATVAQMREEILNLKTILIAHKDCPIAQHQQVTGAYIDVGQYQNHGNPYAIGMQNGQAITAGHNGQRRFS